MQLKTQYSATDLIDPSSEARPDLACELLEPAPSTEPDLAPKRRKPIRILLRVLGFSRVTTLETSEADSQEAEVADPVGADRRYPPKREAFMDDAAMRREMFRL